MPLVSKVYHRWVICLLLLGSGIQACLLLSFFNTFNLVVVIASSILKFAFLILTFRFYGSSIGGSVGGLQAHVKAYENDFYLRTERGALDDNLDSSMKSIDEIDNVIIS
jgi:hypothetical protein